MFHWFYLHIILYIIYTVLQIRAPADGMLGVQSPDGSVNIRGIDGVHIGGTEVNITSTAASNVTLSSQVCN